MKKLFIYAAVMLTAGLILAGCYKDVILPEATVDPDGPAASQGFRSGDIILDVAGRRVASPEEVRKAFADARSSGKRTVLLRVKSGDNTRFLAVPVGRG